MDILDDTQNPTLMVETILKAQGWDYDRIEEDQIQVFVSGQAGEYTLSFIWQEKFGALQIIVANDITYSDYQYAEAAKVIDGINRSLWMGHFQITQDSLKPTFRYTALLRGMTSFHGTEYIADLLEIALCESEKHYASLVNV